MADPLSFLRRSPLRRHLDSKGASWRALADAAVVERLALEADPGALAIADLSPLPRLGFKGRGTIAAMQRRGIVVEGTPNRAFRQPGGGLCLVLGAGEVVLLSNLAGDGSALEGIERSWRIEDEERTYPLLRRDSHCWLAITGKHSPAMLAKLCAIDLRPHKFSDLSIAQTSLAKLTAIIVRADVGGAIAFHILADHAAALYLWGCLIDAAQEFGGGMAGAATIGEIGVHEATHGLSR